ncbi:MAG: hypothetical protein LBI70_03585 [Rickettsiales bacterium]|jgi:hypothetical protein|nr:hypothetical protein [Rickettsiales bacterium]
MWIQKIKEYLVKLVDSLKSTFSTIRSKWSNLYGNNLSQAIEYFDFGMPYECYSRLKIILKIWPNDERAIYLLGLLCVCVENDEEAMKYLSKLDSLGRESVQKLVRVVQMGKSGIIAKKYSENPNLDAVEYEISNIAS